MGTVNPIHLVASTTDPAFAVDREGAILAWNAAAEQTFGNRRNRTLGKHCWEVLDGRDEYGNRYCGAGCPLVEMALRHEAVNRCRIHFCVASGESLAFDVSTLVVPDSDPRGPVVVHLLRAQLRAVTANARDQTSDHAATHSAAQLTPRELEILRRLADGKGSKEIARSMGISITTVRNHVQHLLKKLHAHSRIEAVSRARRAQII